MTTRSALRAEIGAFLDRLSAEGVLPLAELDVATARSEMRRSSLELWGEVEPVAEVAELTFPTGNGVEVRSYRPGPERRLPALVYFHGGGWVVGGIETHDGLCRSLANAAQCAVFSVGYRLAPEHQFPAAANDADAAAAWIHASADELGIDTARMSVAGDSAGGNLAAVTARRLARRGVRLASQILVYPVTDGRTDTASYEANTDGPYLTRADMHWYLGHYASDVSDLRDPDLAPLRAEDLSGLPPAYVATAELDPLRDDGTAYAGRLRAAGVSVRLEDWPGTIHGFLLMRAVTPAADELIASIVRFLSESWARPETP
ncbi:MAG: alpha/beta hydrolase [Solirubrobacterales bacterium]|nr:alpha/beta hydrolase [Solirubrobacterales bacterium]